MSKLYVITYTFYPASILSSEGLEVWEVEKPPFKYQT